MRYKHTLLTITLASSAIVGTAAHADTTYTSSPGDHPFSLTLKADSSPWQNISSQLSSADLPHTSINTTSTIAPVTVYVPAQPGVAGSIDTYLDTTTTTNTTTWNEQSLHIGYSAGLAAPISAPETYILTGQIAKQSDEVLYSGYRYLNFQMGLNIAFLNPYTPNSASGILTFKLSNTPGDWTYVFQTPFDTSSDSVTLSNSLSNWNNLLDFNNPAFFEASYSINGDPGINFGINNLSLNIYGAVASADVVTNTSNTTRGAAVAHYDIPALPTLVPLPAAAWLFGASLCFIGLGRRKKK